MFKWNWWKSRIIFPRENEHLVGTSATLCVGSPYVFSGIYYEFGNKNKKHYNFKTAKGRNLKF